MLNLEKIKSAFYLGNDLYAEREKIAVHHVGREDVEYLPQLCRLRA